MRYTIYIRALILAAGLVAPLRADAQTVTRTIVVRYGWLGINYDITVESRDGKVSENISVLNVVPGSPAEKAGVRKGDRIVRIDGKAATLAKFESLVRSTQPGDTLRLRVAAAERERDLTIVAAERPPEYGPPPSEFLMMRALRGDSVRNMTRIFIDSARIGTMEFSDSIFLKRLEGFGFPGALRLDTAGNRTRIFGDSLGRTFRIEVGPRNRATEFPHFELLSNNSGVAGAEFTQINPGLAHYFGTNKGLLVLRVGAGTHAARAGLEAGDVLTKVDGREIEDVADFRTAIARSREEVLKLDILRKSKSQTLQLDLRRRRE